MHVDRRVYVRTTDARGVCLLVRGSYVSQCARARVTSTDKYGKRSEEGRQFSPIPEILLRIIRRLISWIFRGSERKGIVDRLDESTGFTNGRAETVQSRPSYLHN